MTAQILASELGSLIQDSKRKNSELRNAAEKALQDLKSLPVTSETQLAAGMQLLHHLLLASVLTAKETFLGVLISYLPSLLLAVLKMRSSDPLESPVFSDSALHGPCLETD
jgi:hypothetical protein